MLQKFSSPKQEFYPLHIKGCPLNTLPTDPQRVRYLNNIQLLKGIGRCSGRTIRARQNFQFAKVTPLFRQFWKINELAN